MIKIRFKNWNMKGIALLFLIAATIHAFDLAQFGDGFNLVFQFDEPQKKNGFECLSTLVSSTQQIYQLIGSKDLGVISYNLGDLVLKALNDIQITCEPYIEEMKLYAEQKTGTSNYKEIIRNNLADKYPTIIQYMGKFIRELTGQDFFSAGYHLALTLKTLIIQQPFFASSKKTTVPFNISKFLNEYPEEFFRTLSFISRLNETSLAECVYSIKNLTLIAFNEFSPLDPEKKVNFIQQAVDISSSAVVNCEKAGEAVDVILQPILKAFKEDPATSSFKLVQSVSSKFLQINSLLRKMNQSIQEGNYEGAGHKGAALVIFVLDYILKFD